MTTETSVDPTTVVACPMCGAYSGVTLARAPALLAVCDVLVVHALIAIGKRIVRVERSRFNRLANRPYQVAHTIWKPDPSDAGITKTLTGSWDVIPAMLDNHGCCGVTSRQVQDMMDSYVRDLLVTGTPHQLSELRYRFEEFLRIPLEEPVPYDPSKS